MGRPDVVGFRSRSSIIALQKQADSTLDRIHCASRRRPLSSHLAARLDLPPRGPGVSRVMGACATKPKELMDSGARSGRVSPSMIDPRTSPSPQLSLRRLHLDDPSGAPPSPGYGLHDSGEALFDTVEGGAPGTPPPPPPMYRSASLPPPPFAPTPGAHPKPSDARTYAHCYVLHHTADLTRTLIHDVA